MKSRFFLRRMETLRRDWRAGFTLIELMVVILIIAILAALLMSGILGAKSSAEDARTLVEIDQMAQAMEAYRSKYGEYPPIGVVFSGDSNGPTRLQAHVLKAFQRFAYGAPSIVNPPTNLDPAESLVFWLGGVPIASGGGRGVEGFSANVGNPFQGSGAGAVQRTQPFFAFDTQRLTDIDGDGFWEYLPHGRTTPYVYFRADLYSSSVWTVPAAAGVGGGSIAVPYRTTSTGNVNVPTTWVSPNVFQILAAGADDMFGVTNARAFPNGDGYDPAGTDDDNLTNFSRMRIGRARP